MTAVRTAVRTMVDNSLKPCETLKMLRKEKGWTQIELSFRIYQQFNRSVPSTRISAYENGREQPWKPMREAIAKVFGRTEEEVFPEYFRRD